MDAAENLILDDEAWRRLREIGRPRRYARGTTLLRQGEPGPRVVAVAEGALKVTVASGAGRDVLVAMKGPGELVGELSAIDGMPVSATVSAAVDTDALVLSSPQFLAFLESTPRVAIGLLKNLAAQLRAHDRTQADQDAVDTSVRLARGLLDLAERFGTAGDDGTVVIALDLTQEELAAWVAASREATNRALSKLRESGAIEVARRRIEILDRAQLEGQAS